jgi:hypothetical protein
LACWLYAYTELASGVPALRSHAPNFLAKDHGFIIHCIYGHEILILSIHFYKLVSKPEIVTLLRHDSLVVITHQEGALYISFNF